MNHSNISASKYQNNSVDNLEFLSALFFHLETLKKKILCVCDQTGTKDY